MKSEIYVLTVVIYLMSLACFGLISADLVNQGEHNQHCNHQHPKHHEVFYRFFLLFRIINHIFDDKMDKMICFLTHFLVVVSMIFLCFRFIDIDVPM